jgi:hypothetical protein
MINALKTNIWAILTAVGAFLLTWIKFLTIRNQGLKRKVKRAERQLEFEREINESEAEIEQDFSHRAEEAKKDLDEGNIPDHLRKPDI